MIYIVSFFLYSFILILIAPYNLLGGTKRQHLDTFNTRCLLKKERHFMSKMKLRCLGFNIFLYLLLTSPSLHQFLGHAL